MNTYCDYCHKTVEPEIETRIENYNVKGENIAISASVCTCPLCSMDLWVDEIDDKNLVKAYDVYREKHKLLSPKRIKEIREKYGLTQMGFARILGFGDKTIARYESGSIQEEAPNNLMHLAENTYNFQSLYERNRSKLSELEQRRVDKALNRLNKLSSDYYGASTTYICINLGQASTVYNYRAREVDCV